MTVTIKHVTKYRVRYIWDKKLSRHEFELIEFSFKFMYPHCSIRPALGMNGCVINSKDIFHNVNSEEYFEWLSQLHSPADLYGPIPPPNRADLLKDQARVWSIQFLMLMAVLGWILPVLPGTPFFLLAWWMGWRPSKSDSQVRSETQSEPS